jgi:hypothetical protein
MAASLNLRRTLIAFPFTACCGFAHAFEPLMDANELPLQAQWQRVKYLSPNSTSFSPIICNRNEIQNFES